MSSDSFSYTLPWRARVRDRVRSRQLLARPELIGLLGLTAVLNLWSLQVNGWANTYYSAAVRSMASSWHNFLFASMDPSGLMTVDKPPLSLWVQALSVRVFGYHPLSVLIPQALMGVVAVGLLYDLVRRRFGRFAGFVGGFALATTPIVVAVSRHNNPDELLLLCSVAALWFMLRAFDTGRTRWLVLSGIAVGLGFETKMGVALMVVPALAAAWMWTPPALAPRGRLIALRQLLAGGAAMAAVALAWPLLVTLTPAADRPWISGTSDNSIWSLIFGYNGLGRVAGQNGGPPGGGGFGGTMFGGPTGPFRLLQSGLGDQAGWMLGFAIVVAIALVVMTRLRRDDSRTGWLIMVGGSLATIAVVFSFASGIFHPYYVSLIAPFAAALVGAGAGIMVSRSRSARVIGPLAIAGGVITELVVLGGLNGQLTWAAPLLIGVAGTCAVLLLVQLSPRSRAAAVAVALAVLFAAPTVWAAETIGHPTNGTFPMGGPASASQMGPGGAGGPGGPGGRGGRGAGFAPAGGAGGFGPPAGGFAPPSTSQGGFAGPGGQGGSSGSSQGGFAGPGGQGGSSGSSQGGFAGPGGPGGFGGAGGGSGAPGAPLGFGGNSAELTAAIHYAATHGGGTIGVSSQSSAAAAIVSSKANIAGLGGFSGRESSVSVKWLADEVASGHLRWVLADDSQGPRLPGDTRTGSQTAIAAVEKACPAVTVTTSSGTSVTMYDCQGHAAAILQGGRA